MKRKKKLRSEVVRASSPGFAVEDVTDLQVHRPVGADEHITEAGAAGQREREAAKGNRLLVSPTKSLLSPLFLIFLAAGLR